MGGEGKEGGGCGQGEKRREMNGIRSRREQIYQRGNDSAEEETVYQRKASARETVYQRKGDYNIVEALGQWHRISRSVVYLFIIPLQQKQQQQ